MSLVATDKGGGSFQLAPVGNHLARCTRVIDLGTQRDQYMGKPKIIHKVMVGWELPEETAVFDEEKGEEPFVVSKEYTLSLGEKANLRHDLESWRGKQFTEAELKAFDISKLLGATCMVNVMHKTSKNKRQYASVTTVTRLPKNMKVKDVPKQVTESLVYSIEDGDGGCFKQLPDFIREKIMASEEWKGEKNPPSSEDPSGSDEAPGETVQDPF